MLIKTATAAAVAAGLLIGVTPVAGADEPEPIRYLSGMATYALPDDARGVEIENGTGFHALYGRRPQERGFGWEAGGYSSTFETGSQQGSDFYRWGLGADLTYSLAPWRSIRPFALAGLAYGRNDVYPNARDDYDWSANLGAGLLTKPLFSRYLVARLEARYLYDAYREGMKDVRFGAGLEFALTQFQDPSPGIEHRVRVVEVSTGVYDQDGDGIVDGKDACPDSAKGARVGANGCALARITRLHGVTFEFDSERLRPDARTILGDVADTLKRYPEMAVEIAGHTDSVGSDEYNLSLSQRRAQAVQEALYEAGVAKGQVSAKGYGESDPVAGNETLDGRELNRRVEMRILK